MRTTITLDDALFERLKLTARAAGVTVSAYIQEAVRVSLAKAPHRDEPFKLVTFDGGTPPSVDLDRTSALLVAEDEKQYGSQ